MGFSFDILLADDNTDDVFLLQQAFKKAATAARLQTVPDGLGALSYLNGDGIYRDRSKFPFPDILLLDLNMPRMNGFEVLEWIRQDSQCKRLMVHVLTSSSRELDVKRAYDLGVNTYVMKPSRLDELIDFVKALHNWHQFICLPEKPTDTSAKLDDALVVAQTNA